MGVTPLNLHLVVKYYKKTQDTETVKNLEK